MAKPPKPVIVYGSSSAEMFDYVFGDNPNYHPIWASGWAARGLRAEGRGTYLAGIDRALPARANVFLVFGIVDCYFSATYLQRRRPDLSLDDIATQAARGILRARRLLRRPGRRIYAVLGPLIPPMPDTYWNHYYDVPPLGAQAMARAYQAMARRLSRRMPCVDLVSACADPGANPPYLSARFQRDQADHHPDYVKMQDVLWGKIRDIPGMLPRRDPPHTALYPHKPAGIGKLKEAGAIRPRTCR